MPSGPKKRRAARRKRGGTNAAGEEDEYDGAGNNVSEMSLGDVKPEAVNEKGAKKSEPVVQIALESPPTVESEHVEKIKDVPVLDESVSVGSKAKESEHESVHDCIVVHAPVTESVITVMESSDAVGKKEKESESEPVDQILTESGSKETKGDGYGEVGEGAVRGPMEIVDHGFSVAKDGEEISKEVVLQDPFQEPGVSASDEPQAITADAVDQSVSEVNAERFIEDAQDSLEKPLEVDVSPDHEGVEKECVEVGESAGNDSEAMVKDVVSVMNKGVEVSMEGVLEERLEEPIERSSDEIQAMETKTLDQSNLNPVPSKADHDSSIPDESVSETNVEASLSDGQDSLVDVFHVEDVVQRNERAEVGESEDHGPPAMVNNEVSVVKETEEMSIEGPLEETSESSSNEPQEMVKTVDELVLKKIRVKQPQDTSEPVESVIEVDVETKSIQDDQESFATPLGSPMSPIEIDVHLNGLWNEPIEHSLHEPHLIPLSGTQDTSLPVESVNEVHIQEPLEDPQDSFREPPTISSSLVDVSHVEGIVQESEVGEKERQESESISHDKPQMIPLSETQGTSLPVDSVNEVHIQTPLEDPQDSIKEQPVISSLPVDVSHVEGVVQESEDGKSASQESESASHDKPELIPSSETQDTSLPVESFNEVHIQTPLEDRQDSIKEQPVISSLPIDVSHVEGVVQETEDGESASHDKPELIPSSETQGTSLPVESVNEVHIQTPLEDPQDSIKEPPEICSSLVDVSHDKGIVQESEVSESASQESESASASHDEPQLIPLSETQDTSLHVESVNDVHIRTPLQDPQDSFKEPPAVSSSLLDVSHVEVVQESEVGESAIHDECVFKEGGEISMEGVLEESFTEPIEPSTYELQETVKTGHQSFLDDEDPFVLVESLSEENVETSLKDTQDTLKEPLRESYMDDLSLVEGVVQGEVGESICQDQPTMVNHVHSVLEDDEEDSIEGVLEEPQTMVKAVESESGDSSKEPLDSPSLTEVTFVSRNVDLNGYGTEPTDGYSHGPHAMVKTTDDLVVSKEIDFEKSQDPWLRAGFIEENGDTSLKEDQDSFKEPMGDSTTDNVSFMDHGQPIMVLNPVESAIKEYEEIYRESVLEEPLEELLGSSSHEPVQTDDELVLKEITLDGAQDPSLLVESVIEANVRAYSKDDQGPSVLTDVSLVEGVVEGNNCVVGECTCDCALINHVVSEGRKIPLEGVQQYPFKEANGDSSHEPQEAIDTIDQLVMKTTSLKETQDPYVPIVPVSEVDVETSSKDGQDSLKELPESPSLEETSTIEGFNQFNGDGNEKIGQSSHEQQGDVTYVEDVVTGNECDEEIPIEGVLEKPLEDPSGHSSDEIEAIVKTLDESVVKEMPLKEDEDPFIPGDSVSEANVETVSFKDVQEYSLKVPPVTSFLVNVPPVEGNEYDEVGESTNLVNPFVLGIEEDDEISIEGDLEEPFKKPDVSSSYEPQEIVKEVDQSVSKALSLTEVQNPSEPADSIKEVNVETFFKDSQDYLTKGYVQGNKYDEVSGSACHGPPSMVNHDVSVLEDEEMCTECVLEEHFKELTEISSDELQAMLKTVESGNEANVEISSKGSQDSGKEPMADSYMDNISPIEGDVQGSECGEVEESTCDGQPTMVNHVESVTNKDEEMSMEDDFEEPETTVRIVDQLILEGIPTKEAQDPFVQVESKTEVIEESSFKEAQDSTKDLPNNRSLIEDHTQAINKMTNDQVVPKEMPLEEAQDDLSSGESIIEKNVETSFKDGQDSLKVSVSPYKGIIQGKVYDDGGENGAIVTFVELSMTANEDMSREGVLEEPSKELIGSSLDDSDQSTPKEKDILLEEDGAMSMEIPSLGDAYFDHVGESASRGSPATVKHVVSDFKEDGVMSMEGVLEDAFEYPTRTSRLEAQAMVCTNDELVPNGQHLKEVEDPFVPANLVIKVKVDTSFEDAEDSFETPLGSPSVGNVSHVEDFAELNGDQNDQVVLKVIPMEETQEPYLPTESVDEENVETSIEDSKDHSSMESLRSFPTADVSSIKGVAQDNKHAEVGETACDGPLETVIHDVSVDSVLNDEKDVSMKDVLEESLKEPNEPFSDELQTKVKTVNQTVQDPAAPGAIQENEYTEDGANVETSIEDAKNHSSMDSSRSFPMADVSSIEGFVQDNERAEVGETACDGPLATVNHDVSVDSVLKDEKEVSMKDVLEESLKEPNEPFSDELQTKVKTVAQTVQDPSAPGEGDIQEKEYTEDGANVETSIEDAKDHSSMDSLRNFPMADVSSIEGFVQDNEHVEVGETACDGPLATVNHDVSADSKLKDEKEVSMKDVLEESLKEPNEPFSDELQTKVKTVDQTVQDPSVPGESNYEANLDTSLKYNQISLKEPLVSPFIFIMSPLEGAIQEKEYTEGGENATTVYHVESLAKEIKDSSIEGDLEESLKEQVGHSSHEQEALVSSIVRSLLKEIPTNEDRDPFAPIESEVNVETSFQDVQYSESIGSPSQVDVFPSEEIVQGNEFEKADESAFHGLPVMANHVMPLVKESEGMVKGSSVEAVGPRNGQRNEMVGLVRSLLEEIRRIRAFYEEGLRQTTEIHLHMSQVLEKFDSDKLI